MPGFFETMSQSGPHRVVIVMPIAAAFTLYFRFSFFWPSRTLSCACGI